ncbi:hypothetical protein [Arthrobacter sp. A2-55]|uniref:hypothetical protein n=1 Tax=Arthrobacter sp. A2-55 TaxID=2897337 RepID=UPI0021CD2934|nr:hypothetical protein [Arthrobacter sp. A2-55]MCU6480177.1 hypothetical protein [Arthrobacter sp. A2-55]
MTTQNPITRKKDLGQAGNGGRFGALAHSEPPASASLTRPNVTVIPFAGQGRLYNTGTSKMSPWPGNLPAPEVGIVYSDAGTLETYVTVGEDLVPFWGDPENFGGITCGARLDPEEYPDFEALSEADREAVIAYGRDAHENATLAVDTLTSALISNPDVHKAIVAHATAKPEAGPTPYASRSVARAERIIALYDQGNESGTYLRDILADLRHYADAQGVDFHASLDGGAGYYAGELEDDAAGNYV